MNYIIRIAPNESGSRPPIQSWSEAVPPDGFALCPESFIQAFIGAKCFVNITVKSGIVTAMTENTVAKKSWEATQIPIPADQRKTAYATLACILWEGEQITVDSANTLWVAYSAEGSTKASQLSTLIEAAKQKIRAMYPDAAA